VTVLNAHTRQDDERVTRGGCGAGADTSEFITLSRVAQARITGYQTGI